MSYTQEDLSSMPTNHLVNMITSVCDSGVREYLRDMRNAQAELARRRKCIRFIQVPSQLIPGKWSREAVLVE